MDNVKEFINKFVLSEKQVDVAVLRENIETLSELESLLERSKRQLTALEKIIDKHEKIEKKDYAIRVNEILLQIADCSALQDEQEKLIKQIRLKRQSVQANNETLNLLETKIRNVEEQIVAIQVDMASNSSNRQREKAEKQIDELNVSIKEKTREKKRLEEQLQYLKEYLRDVATLGYEPISRQQWELLGGIGKQEEKSTVVGELEAFGKKEQKELELEWAKYKEELRRLSNDIDVCQERLRGLNKQILPYPEYADKLKKAVEKEFTNRGIHSNIYFLSELLEITDMRWSDAVEGYLHTQKFYLVVEPEYYDIALSVYDKNRRRIHTAGIINSKKLPLDGEIERQSLAYVIKSENRYARAYANYVLGRVMRCDTVEELGNHAISITPECMLYQSYVVRHINPKHYENPFIGQNAYRVQIQNVRKEIEEKTGQRSKLRERLKKYSDVKESADKVKLELVKLYLNTPDILLDMQQQLEKAKLELKTASNDPTLIELEIRLEEMKQEKSDLNGEKNKLTKENSRLNLQIEAAEEEAGDKGKRHEYLLQQLQELSDAEGLAYKEAEEKYRQNRKTKSARTIAGNFAPQRSQFLNEREELLNGNYGLRALQMQFNQDYTLDFMTGMEGMAEYREARQKLQSVDIIHYEEKLKSAKEDCEEIFRSDFLSRMKEHIEAARNEFRSLNKALSNIYYGDDNYHFKISFDKSKEGLYRMITSENNQEGFNLWTSAFETEYKEEMSDLFDKLMTRDDSGKKIVEEYTDYRSYLDYDIEIHKRDGSVQRFSDIYGEKSGSETQVPYYVAIAASYYQLYHYGNSVRLMLLDEAFDKMDDERIRSMMDFFNGLGLQVILATPPAKIEIIGEHVATILTAIRVDQNSIVEEYDL